MKYKISKEDFPDPKDFQLYGYPRSGGRSHEGHDLVTNPARSFPIYSLKEGYLKRVKFLTKDGYVDEHPIAGYRIDVIHPDGTKSVHTHITKESYYQVINNKRIGKGDYVAMVGKSGNATTYCLHYELHRNGRPINPLPEIIEEFDPTLLEDIRWLLSLNLDFINKK